MIFSGLFGIGRQNKIVVVALEQGNGFDGSKMSQELN
jgi:hypothetical protein